MKLNIRLLSTVASALTLTAATLPALAQETPAEVIHWMTTPSESAALKIAVDQFEKEGGKWIDTGISPSTTAKQVEIQRVTTGDPPEAIMLVSKIDAMQLLEGGFLGDVRDVAEADGWSSLLPASAMDVISHEGQVYAVPFEFQMTNIVWYNIEVLKSVGIETAPQTWDEMIAALEAVQQKGNGIIPFANQSEDSAWRNTFNFAFAAKGGPELYNAVYRDRSVDAIKSPEFRAMAEAFKSLKAFTDPGAPARKWNESMDMVATGAAAMNFIGTWGKGPLLQAKLEPGVDFGCSVLGGAPIINSAMFVFPKLDDPKRQESQRHLARVFMNPEVQSGFAAIKGGLPTNSKADTSAFDFCSQNFVKTLADGPEKAVLDAQLYMDTDTMAQLVDLAVQYWNDSLTIDQFVDQFATVVPKALVF